MIILTILKQISQITEQIIHRKQNEVVIIFQLHCQQY